MRCAERNPALGALAILALSACALHAQAQRQVVVPPGFALREASGLEFGALSPFDLAPLSAPGCVVRTDIVSALPFTLVPEPHTTTQGIATAALECPLHPALAGARLHAQWWLADPACNALGLAGSNALQVDFALPPGAIASRSSSSTAFEPRPSRPRSQRVSSPPPRTQDRP